MAIYVQQLGFNIWQSAARVLAGVGMPTLPAGPTHLDYLVYYGWNYAARTLFTTPIAGLASARDGTDPTKVAVTWTAFTGAVSYQVSKDGGAFSSAGISGTTFTDAAGSANTGHTYSVQAVDVVGNIIAQGTADFLLLTLTANNSIGTLGVAKTLTWSHNATNGLSTTLTLTGTGGAFSGANPFTSSATQGTLTFTPTAAAASVLTIAGTNASESFTSGSITLTTAATTLTLSGGGTTTLAGTFAETWTESAASPGTLSIAGNATLGASFSPTLPAASGTIGLTLTNLTAGNYSLIVSGTGAGYQIAGGTVTITVPTPTTPTDLSGVGVSFTSLAVQATYSAADTSVVVVSTNGTVGPFSGTLTLNGSGNATGTLTGLTTGTAYTLAARAWNNAAFSAISSTASASTWVSMYIAVTKSGVQVELSWDLVVGAASYQVSKDGGAFSSTGVGDDVFDDVEGSANAGHTYIVQAVDSRGNVIAQGTGRWVAVFGLALDLALKL